MLEVFKPIKVMTQAEVKEELYKLRQKQAIQGLATGCVVLATPHLINLIKPLSATLDLTAKNIFSGAISHTTSVTAKMSRVVFFPYAGATTVGTLYTGAFALILLLLLTIIIKEKIEGKSNKEVFMDCATVLIAPILWILVG